MSDQVTVGDYSLEISGDEVLVRDENGVIVESVELDDVQGQLTLPDGQQIDLASVFAGSGVEALQTAAGPANDNTGAIGGGPVSFHPFGADAQFDGLLSAGTLGGTSLNSSALNVDEEPNYDPNAQQQAPVPVTWSSHDPWQIAENQSGGSFGELVNGNPGDFTFEVSDARFEVVDGILRVRDGVSFDYESEPGIEIEITATSRTGEVKTLSTHIGVTDVNEAQTDLSIDSTTVEENAPGAVIGTLTVADPDAGDSQTFSVSDDRFEIVDGQLKLKDGVSLDHEGEPIVNVTVTATDGGGHQIQQTFAITVGDVNEAPTDINLSGNALVENVAGAVIGALTAIDPDAGDTHMFEVSDSRFEVVDGQLKLKDSVSIDFETEPSLNVTVTATDSAGNKVQESFTLAVTDANEAQTALSLNNASVAENAAGAVVGSLTVTDPDAGDSQSFAVSDNRFEVVDGQLKLKDGVSLDHESEPNVSVTVTATDGAGHQIQQDFAITVGDVNEAPLSLSLTTDSTQLLLNGSFEANKLNSGQWQLFGAIDGWTTNTQIEIQNNVTNKASNGAQVVEMDADNKIDNIYQDVQTVAGHAYQLTFDTATRNDTKHTDTIEIYWNGVKIGSVDPQSPTWQSNSFQVIGTGGSDRLEFREVGGNNDNYGGLLDNVALKGMGATVPENFGGVVIGALQVTDPDIGDSHSFSISDSRFEVVDGQLKLKSDASFNYEAEQSVNVTVTATDTAGHQIQQTFSITIGDVNEAQTALTWTGTSVTENSAGAVAGTLRVADPDAGDAQSFKVSDSRFEVVNNQLKLKSGVSLDFEQGSSVNVTVTSTDKAGHQIQQTFAVSVQNVNETQTGMSLSASKVTENAGGAVIGVLSVSDPDAGDSQSFKVSDSRFEVVNNQLTLKSGVSLDYEQGSSVNVTVTATDSANHQYAKTFAVSVTDVNEAPTAIQLSNLAVNENAAGAAIGMLTTSDPDAGDTFSYQVSDNRFEIVGGQIQLKSGLSLDHESEPSVNLQVISTDSAGHSIQQSFTVNVANVNEAPTVTSTDGSFANHIINTSTAYNPVANAAVGGYLYSNDSKGIKVPGSSLLNGIDPSNMTLSAATPVTVTFQKEAAGNHNMIGTYQYDDNGNVIAGSVKFVWLDASAGNEGKLGATMVTDFLGYSQSNVISLGTMPAGTHVGFFAISNGANDSGNTSLLTNVAAGTSNQADAMSAIAGQLSIQVDANGNGHVFVGNSQMNGDVFFTHNKSLNTDFNDAGDIDHMASGVSADLPGQLLIGVEDLKGGGDKDYNDVVFSVDLGTYNVNKITQNSLQPTADFSDVDSDTLSQAVIHTSGFQAGDALNVPPSGAFNVTVSQAGADYTITIVGKTGAETVDQYETFANSIYFSTSSTTEGERHIDYTVTDSGGLTATVSTADIGVTNSYDVSSSQLGTGQTTLGSGDDVLHVNTSGIGPINMGDGYDTVHLAKQDMAFGHNEAVKIGDVEAIDATGYGANNVSLSIGDVLNMTDADNHLTIIGDKGDTVTLTANGTNQWSVVESNAEFTTYAYSDPSLQAVVEISNQLNAQVS